MSRQITAPIAIGIGLIVVIAVALVVVVSASGSDSGNSALSVKFGTMTVANQANAPGNGTPAALAAAQGTPPSTDPNTVATQASGTPAPSPTQVAPAPVATIAAPTPVPTVFIEPTSVPQQQIIAPTPVPTLFVPAPTEAPLILPPTPLPTATWTPKPVVTCNPSVSFSPPAGRIGTSVTMTGIGFPADQPVTLSLAGLGSTQYGSTNGTGGFSFQYTVPAGSFPGTYTIKAAVGTCGAGAPFTVQ